MRTRQVCAHQDHKSHFMLRILRSSLSLKIAVLCLLTFKVAAQERRFTHDDFLKAFPKPVANQLEEAKNLYQARCVQCHGAKGEGDGLLARHMSPKPRNLRNSTWFESLDYSARIKRLKRSIIGGGPAVGGSALMPPNPDLRNKPELLYALVYYLALPHKPSPIVEQEPTPEIDSNTLPLIE